MVVFSRPLTQIAGALAAGLLAACTDLGPSPESLTAKATGTISGPNCASCHPYPLLDSNHVYHLFSTDSSITNDQPITCLHCHDRSIAARIESYADSIFVDSAGNEFHALDFPQDAEMRTFPLARVETLVVRRAVPAPPRSGALPVIREWLTSYAHMNGIVDVEFNSTSQDTARFHGHRASFNREKETCSSVACHPNHGPYRWSIPSRGLPTLKGETPEPGNPGG